MTLDKFLIVLIVFSLTSTGCNCPSSQCSLPNPFAQTAKTVAPPATFSSQESYLGQMPGNYVPKTPAATFPPVTTTPPPAVGQISPTPTISQSAWSSAEVQATNQTAFQAMDAKLNADTSASSGLSAHTAESLAVGSTYTVTTISDE
ncbi:MAG: hypothetical protein FWG73_09510 [Planctomycetaceae bacterium]|nr:hypothetical protein [Planctomycetaceae bacterium]